MRQLCIFVLVIMTGWVMLAADDTEQKVKTIYGADGRPTRQSVDAAGWHQVADSCKLTAGRAVVTINTSTVDGRQDLSFKDKKSYRGAAWSLDTTNTNTYRVYPLSGSTFLVRSGSGTDSSWVLYRVEGE